MKRPKLGEWLTVRKHAGKRHDGNRTTWHSWDAPQIERAMFIGYRTVFNGTREADWEYEEGHVYNAGFIFFQSEALEVWLFVYNGRMNPFRAFPQDTDFLEKEDSHD